MPSRSPSPTRSYRKQDKYSRRDDSDYRRSKPRDDRGSRDDTYSRRHNTRDKSGYRDEDEKYGSSRGKEYSERDREKERARDRDRYHDRDRYERDRNRAGPSSSRRSASPPSRTSRPRPSRSASPGATKEKEKGKPNFGASGLLAAATNTVKGTDGSSTVLKYNEPPEARKPALGWRLYVFKGDEQVELLHIHRQSAYLIGRDRLVADIPIDHPSCSKQHAAIQHRQVQEKDEYGSVKTIIKPFIIDLESTNGTHVNGAPIPTSRFYELQVNDMIKFGLSEREYVLLHDEAS